MCTSPDDLEVTLVFRLLSLLRAVVLKSSCVLFSPELTLVRYYCDITGSRYDGNSLQDEHSELDREQHEMVRRGSTTDPHVRGLCLASSGGGARRGGAAVGWHRLTTQQAGQAGYYHQGAHAT